MLFYLLLCSVYGLLLTFRGDAGSMSMCTRAITLYGAVVRPLSA